MLLKFPRTRSELSCFQQCMGTYFVDHTIPAVSVRCSVLFSVFTGLCSQHHGQFWNILVPPEQTPCPCHCPTLASPSAPRPLQHGVISDVLLSARHLVLTQAATCARASRRLVVERRAGACLDHTLRICSLVGGHLCCFLLIINSTAVNTGVDVWFLSGLGTAREWNFVSSVTWVTLFKCFLLFSTCTWKNNKSFPF